MMFKMHSDRYSSVSKTNALKMKQYRDILFSEGYSVVYKAYSELEEDNGYYFITVHIKSLQHLDKLVKVLGEDVVYSGDGWLTINEGVFK